jgi:hypothetical protein
LSGSRGRHAPPRVRFSFCQSWSDCRHDVGRGAASAPSPRSAPSPCTPAVRHHPAVPSTARQSGPCLPSPEGCRRLVWRRAGAPRHRPPRQIRPWDRFGQHVAVRRFDEPVVASCQIVTGTLSTRRGGRAARSRLDSRWQSNGDPCGHGVACPCSSIGDERCRRGGR